MISVSNDFKNAVKASTKQIKAYIVDNEIYPDEITESDDLQSVILKGESSLLRTVMRYGEAVYFGNHDYLSKYINVGLGVVLPDTTTEFIDYGSFRVTSQEYNKANDTIKIKFFDKMYESLIAWDLDPIYDRTYPCTLKQLLEAICDRLGWTLKSTTFPNDGTTVNNDPFTNVITTYREALDQIAEMAGSIIYFDVDNELVVTPIAKDTPLEELTPALMNTLTLEEKYGEINSVVLSRQPTEDNILEKNQTSIDANGLTEIKIKNNRIADSDRETWITEIFSTLFELEFYPFSTTTNGLGYFQIGDRIEVTDLNSVTREVVVMGFELKITGGLKEKLFCDIPDKNSTNYNTAGIINQRIRQTEIIVDKQKGEIIIINQDLNDSVAQINLTTDTITSSVNQALQLIDQNQDDITDIRTDITTLQQTADALELAVEGIGGTNLLKNSVGLKGNLAEWQELDSNGNPIDSRNGGTIVQTTDVETNSESGSAIQLLNQFILQTFPTIAGETYTVYSRYKSNGVGTLKLTGFSNITIPTSADWTIFKHQFVAASSSTTLTIETGSGITGTFTDIICKLGDVNGWMQAPNEVYGANFRFDKEGFQITSLTDTFKSLLDNQKLAVYDTAGGSDRIIMLVSKDSGKITKLTVQDEFIVQRYENSSKSVRIIPTTTGAMLVIND